MGVLLGVTFQIHPVYEHQEKYHLRTGNRKKDGIPITQNVPIRMRVVFASQRIEFTTGYRIDMEKWDADKQRVRKRLYQ